MCWKCFIFDCRHQTRKELAQTIATERSLTLILPYDHPHIIADQGTIAKELIETVGELDV